METNTTPSISELYYKYKRVDLDEIKKYLTKVKYVILTNKGHGTIHGYYPLSDECLAKMVEAPRGKSLTFDLSETADEPILNLEEYKRITFLVKSTSRFFLKPDIGEIFDQIDWNDLFGDKPAFDAIALTEDQDYETLPGTQGEHHLMSAILLKYK